MPKTLAIIAALPREIAALVRGTEPHQAFLHRGVYLYHLPDAVVVAGGMGAHRVTLAFEAARAVAPVSHVISTGLAGACSATLPAGSVAEASVVIEGLTGERFTGSGDSDHVLVTSHAIAGVAEKARLAEAYGAAIVDMEAATVARLAVAHGVQFRAIKAISDGHEFEMTSLSKFAGDDGHFRTASFAVHTALRPKQWAKAMELGSNSKRALAKLKIALEDAIKEAKE